MEHSIEILYEDDDAVVINKPAGIMVHPDGRTKASTISDWALSHFPHMKEVGEPTILSSGETLYRPGVVHRLDKETSGALLLAKNQNSFLSLKTQFQDRDITKEYHVFVYGSVKAQRGVIDRPIGKSKSDFRKWTAQRGTRGELRDARTRYTTIVRTPNVSFLHVWPETGRTHQIRVHLKAINHPVVADSLYSPNKPSLLGFNRLALHAYSVEFDSLKGKRVKVLAPYPPDFENAMREIRGMS